MCRGCGQPLEESTARGADDAYTVRVIACHACAAKERAADSHIPGALTLISRDKQPIPPAADT